MVSGLNSSSPVARNSLRAETPLKQDDGGDWALPRLEIKDHIVLILRVKETFLSARTQKGSLALKKSREVIS